MALTKVSRGLLTTSIVDNGNATAITIDSSENVGIGGAPSTQLFVKSAANAANVFAIESADAAQRLQFGVNTSNGGSYIFEQKAQALRFGTSDTERMRLTSAGRLVVNGTVAGYSGTDITVGSTTQATSGLSILNSTTGTGYLLFGDDDGDAAGGYRGQISYSHNSGEMYFVVEGATRFYINLSGHPFFPYIRNSAGSYTAKITAGSAELTFDTSSARYKDNIRDSTYGLSAAMQLQSRMFEYKEDNQRTDVGFIAEEVNEVIPELVVIDSEGRPDAVNYDRMTSVLLKAIQEQQATIEALTQRIETLENN